jgi:SAM-dependent methyltransferase
MIAADVRELPFPDACFDSVVCIEVLEYLPDYVKALREFRRVLKDGGRLLITVPFMSPVHGVALPDADDTDFMRLTARGWAHALSDLFISVRIRPLGGKWTIAADCVLAGLKGRGLAMGAVRAALLCPALLAVRIDERFPDPRFVSGYVIECSV